MDHAALPDLVLVQVQIMVQASHPNLVQVLRMKGVGATAAFNLATRSEPDGMEGRPLPVLLSVSLFSALDGLPIGYSRRLCSLAAARYATALAVKLRCCYTAASCKQGFVLF